MLFKLEKLTNRVLEIEPLRYKNRKPITGWTIHEDESKSEKYPPQNVSEKAEELTVNRLWEGRDRYFWIMGEVDVPEVSNEEDFVLLFDFGKSSEGNNSGFEAMLYINDEPYQAVDGNHKEVIIDKSFANQTISVALRLWGGLEGGGAAGEIWHLFKYADSSVLCHSTDDLYYTALVIIETIEILDENDSDRVNLLELLDDTFKKVDWSDEGSPSFYDSVEKANHYLQNGIDSLEKKSDINVTMVGHTHIDVAWLWRLKHTREKAARSFSTVFRLMEQYPEYIFLQTQPQLYEYLKEDYPELYEKIKEKVREDKWEIEGAMWLESDANIPSGESLVRQLLFGSRFMKKEFNHETKYLWLPDVFGYSWALPQILKKSGIDLFMTTKISWSQLNRMPNDTFYWKGLDGSEILTHFITTPSSKGSEEFSAYTYNGEINPYTVKGVYDSYRDKDINKNLLIAYGYGDGGGGVNRTHLEKARRIQRLPGLPNLQPGKAGKYFKELEETIEEAKKKGKYVHTWDGELYLELHRGTYTSQARNKKWNRKLELAYRDAEILWAWGNKLAQEAFPQVELNDGWKIILRNQFHDIIPGSSIKEVYEDSEIEYQEARDTVDQQMNKFSELLEKEPSVWTLFNTASWSRDEVVTVNGTDYENGYFTDEQDNILKTVQAKGQTNVYVENIPPLGSKVIYFKEGEAVSNNAHPFSSKENGIDTPFYTIEWNEDGHITSIYDKEHTREVLSANGSGNVFQLFEDKPLAWDAWDIDIFYQEKGKNLTADSIVLKEVNEIFAVIEFTYNFGSSSIKQDMKVYSDSRRIDFATNVNWKERQQLLKVKFDVDVRAIEATYDIQYGNAKRPTHWNTSWEMAKFETVGHQWADISEKGYGVSLLNDSKYGYDIKESTMRLSLLKGPIYPDPDADIGEHSFVYSLYPHKGDYVEGRTVEAAWALNSPLKLLNGRFSSNQFIEIESDESVMVDTIKKAEDNNGVIIRLHNFTGGRQTVSLSPKFNYQTWQETNLMEKPISKKIKDNTQPISFDLKPYEVKTFLIE